MEKNYKTKEMSILRVENGQVPGLGWPSTAWQDPTRNEQLQPLGFPRLCKSRCSLSCPTAALPRLRWFPQQYPQANLALQEFCGGVWNQGSPLEQQQGPAAASHKSRLKNHRKNFAITSECPTHTGTSGCNTTVAVIKLTRKRTHEENGQKNFHSMNRNLQKLGLSCQTNQEFEYRSWIE